MGLEKWRKIGNRISFLSNKAKEEIAIGIAEEVLNIMMGFLPLTVELWDEAMEKLTDKIVSEGKNIEDVTDDDILEVMDSLADKIDINRSLQSAPPIVKNSLMMAMVLAKRIGKREWFEKMRYDRILMECEKRNLDISVYLRKYPNLTKKLIEWLRKCLMK